MDTVLPHLCHFSTASIEKYKNTYKIRLIDKGKRWNLTQASGVAQWMWSLSQTWPPQTEQRAQALVTYDYWRGYLTKFSWIGIFEKCKILTSFVSFYLIMSMWNLKMASWSHCLNTTSSHRTISNIPAAHGWKQQCSKDVSETQDTEQVGSLKIQSSAQYTGGCHRSIVCIPQLLRHKGGRAI